MLHREFEPSGELLDTIKCFWYNRKDSGPEQTAFEVVPDGYAEIIFYFGSLSTLIEGRLVPLPSPFMMGLLNQPARFYTQGRLEVLAVRCFPWTVFDLLGLPSEKGGLLTFDHPVGQLQDTLANLINTNKIEDATDLLNRYFVTARSQVAKDSMLFKAGRAMNKAKGILPVSEVAAAAHATVRTLERKFRQSSGHSVKDVTGLMRFEQVRNALWHNPTVSLAGLAHDFGYADQSHLSKEFKRYTGTTPAAFARKARSDRRTAS